MKQIIGQGVDSSRINFIQQAPIRLTTNVFSPSCRDSAVHSSSWRFPYVWPSLPHTGCSSTGTIQTVSRIARCDWRLSISSRRYIRDSWSATSRSERWWRVVVEQWGKMSSSSVASGAIDRWWDGILVGNGHKKVELHLLR